MTNNVNLSESEKTLHILKYYINGLTDSDGGGFLCLNGMKEFDDIISKPSKRSFAKYTFDDLSADIDKLVANTEKKSNRKFKTSAERLREHWSAEVAEIRRCIDCYFYWITEEENCFTRVCTKPHLLVYVQESVEDGSRWWPAKVLSVDDDENKVTIESFGDHLRANCGFSQCILYFKTDLNTKIMHAKNSRNGIKRDEFILAFQELGKHIKNFKERYGDKSFVPATSDDQTIMNVNQHLDDMFPTAFKQDIPTAADGTKLKTTLANNQHNGDNGNDEPFNAKFSPVSQGYGTQYSGFSSHSNDFVESEIRPNRQQRLITAAGIKTENSQYYADTDAVDEPDILPQGSDASSTIGMANGRKQTRKRKNDDDSVVMENPATKRNSIVIDDEQDTERPSTSSQNHKENRPVANDKIIETILKEIDEIIAEIVECDKNLKPLKEEKTMIKAELKIGITDFDIVMTNYNEIAEKIAELERDKEALKAKKAIVVAKLKNHLN